MSEQLLLRIPEAGRRLGLGRSKIYALVANGTIPAVQISERSYRIAVSALEAYVRRLERDAEIGPGGDGVDRGAV